MKRVLSISTLYPNAHMPRFGTFVARSLEALAARGDWEVTMINPIGIPPIAFGKYKPLAQALTDGQENGVDVHRPRFTLIPKMGGRANPSIIARKILPLVKRLHAQSPFHVVDAQFFYPDGPAAAWIAEQMQLPLSIKARGSDITMWGHKAFAMEQMLAAADRANGLLAVSEELARNMGDLGLPYDKIRLHYTGLDRDRFRPLDHGGLRGQLAETLGIALPAKGPLITTVGALVERKGQEFVIGALADLPGAHLMLVGQGPDEKHLRRLASDMRVSERVHFLGSIDHDLLPVVLSAADVMALPSSREGLANAWVEALACGTRVVTCDVGGARELVTDSTAGILVDRSVDGVLGGINQVLDHPCDSQEVAEMVSQFSWQNNAEALAKYYDRLAGFVP